MKALAALPALRWIERRPDYLLAIAVSGIVGMLIIPLPSFLLDALISVNMAVSLVVLLVALFSKNVLELTTFPSLLLMTTLFRLGLNVSTTRGILAHGEAGSLVKAFGGFIVQGDIIVGAVIFLVVTLVQFMVVAKGAERVAEVGARFTLDAMPGKQMSIDAAVRQGSINEEEAQEKRDELGRLSQLFGNMDGAMKFVKGDAIAGLIITGVNIVGGLLIGIFRNKMDAGSALDTYATLTIGDALVAQAGSLLVTLAAGMLVTRVEAKDKTKNLGFMIRDEVAGSFKVLFVGSGLLMVLSMIPGVPGIPFFILSGIIGAMGMYRMVFPPVALFDRAGSINDALNGPASFKKKMDKKLEEAKAQKGVSDSVSPSVVPISLDIDPTLSTALGFTSAEVDERAELMAIYIPQLRDALYMETGVRFPGIRVRPNVKTLPPSSFMLRVNDVPVLQESVPVGKIMAMSPPEALARFNVECTTIQHPVSKAKMSLIDPEAKAVVEAGGIVTWTTPGIVALYVAGALRTRTKMFIGLQEVSDLMERLEKAYPALVKEVVPKTTSVQQLVNVLRRLVDENVCVRDLKSIVESLGEHGSREADPLFLTERVRATLAPQLAYSYAGLENRLAVVMLDPVIEDTISAGIHTGPQGTMLTLPNEVCRQIMEVVSQALQPVVASGKRPVILTNSEIRRFVRKLVEVDLPQVAVVSFDELPSDLTVQPMGRAQLSASN